MIDPLERLDGERLAPIPMARIAPRAVTAPAQVTADVLMTGGSMQLVRQPSYADNPNPPANNPNVSSIFTSPYANTNSAAQAASSRFTGNTWLVIGLGILAVWFFFIRKKR